MIKETEVIGRECRFAVYIPPAEHGQPDLHLVKEQLHLKDGKLVPNVRLIPNFKRDFYVTKKGMQNHQSKKESEKIEHLIKTSTTQSMMDIQMGKALGQGWVQDTRKLKESPYLYGADIMSTAIIKKMYQDKYPGLASYYSLAVFDVETDVVEGHERIIMASLTMMDKVFCAVDKNFVSGYTDVRNSILKLADKYIGDIIKQRNINIELVFLDSEIDIVRDVFQKAHEWQPDFVAVWNIDFDIGTKVIGACKSAGVDPKDIFSDPKVPKENRFFKYKQGPKQKVTASGVVTPIKPAAQWHVVTCPSSFYLIDAMCVYRQIRTGKQEERSYSLDAILSKEKIKNKLNFEEVQNYTGIKWHQVMQTKHKLEYIVYNIFDCICVELLDEKTYDLRATMPMFSGYSDFSYFNSQPRRLVDKLHYFYLEKGEVFGTTAGNLKEDIDSESLDLSGWIINLDATLILDNGLCNIEENTDSATRVHMFAGDLDVSASYPNGQCVSNMSKATTKKEIVKIHGVDEYTARMQSINLNGGQTNALEFCQTLMGFPTLDQLLVEFQKTF